MPPLTKLGTNDPVSNSDIYIYIIYLHLYLYRSIYSIGTSSGRWFPGIISSGGAGPDALSFLTSRQAGIAPGDLADFIYI